MTTELINKSVTRFDYGQQWQTIGIPSIPYTPKYLRDPEDVPWSWRERDRLLAMTTRVEGWFGNAVNIAINQLQSAMWEIESDVPLRRNRARQILTNSDYYKQLGLIGRDFFTTNNGGFLEIIRATSARGSRILGFQHLDSLQCQRTGDRERPVIYTDRFGREHALHWWQVTSIVDAESPRVDANGMGECAAERIYSALYKFATIERYMLEKVAGRRVQAMVFLNGVSGPSLESAMASSEASSPARQTESMPAGIDPALFGGVDGVGYGSGGQIDPIKRSYVFGGVRMVPVATSTPVEATVVDIASLPDGFDYKEELSSYLLKVAKSLNIDPQDLAPLVGGQFGTGTQSKVMQEKNSMYGAASFRQQWERGMQIVTGEGTVFYLVENDIARRHNEALLAKTHTEDLAIQIDKGMITPEQAVTIKVANDELPNEFATVASTETVNQYSDSEADNG